MAIGIGAVRADGSVETVAVFREEEAVEVVQELILSIEKRGHSAKLLTGLDWPYPDSSNIWSE